MLAAAGLLLPAIIVLAVWANNLFDQRRAAVEREALDSARQMVALADAEAVTNSRLLGLLATSNAARDPTMDRMNSFFDLVLETNSQWNGLALREETTGRVLIDKGRGIDQRPLRDLPATIDQPLGNEGVFATGRYCPCVVFHRRVSGAPDRILSLFMAPDAYQDVMRSYVAGTTVGGLVDRQGRFLARSVDFIRRVGTPATSFVRRAAAKGGEGYYRGETYEGLVNFTAYATSPVTGWSGHVAVVSTAVDNPRNVANLSVVIAILATLILAAGLIFYAYNEARARQREEAQFVALQKSEVLGRFTSTVVHDFRNILAVIESGIRLIVRNSQEPRTVEFAQAMTEAVDRGNRLINQLLSFARGDEAEIRRVDLKSMLAQCDQLLARSLGDGVSFSWSVADDARYARANADQLELALLNLAVNARDAMDGSGTFTIEASRDRDRVALAASDSGPGVPQALRDRIFQAFYSTKDDGRGTGLGLAQVAGAARQAGGEAVLTEAPGGGARFVLYLPRE